jgi:hypothetical protein
VAREKGGVGFLLWNAQNDYGKPYAAMTQVAAHHNEYFRGDEIVDTRKPAENVPTAPAGFKTVSAPNRKY